MIFGWKMEKYIWSVTSFMIQSRVDSVGKECKQKLVQVHSNVWLGWNQTEWFIVKLRPIFGLLRCIALHNHEIQNNSNGQIRLIVFGRAKKAAKTKFLLTRLSWRNMSKYFQTEKEHFGCTGFDCLYRKIYHTYGEFDVLDNERTYQRCYCLERSSRSFSIFNFSALKKPVKCTNWTQTAENRFALDAECHSIQQQIRSATSVKRQVMLRSISWALTWNALRIEIRIETFEYNFKPTYFQLVFFLGYFGGMKL